MSNGVTDQFSNYATTTVAGGAGGVGTSLAAGDTTLYLTDASRFPQPGAFSGFMLVLTSGATSEIARCTARSGNTLTITRGQEGTSAALFPVGATATVENTAGSLTTVQTLLSGINNQYLFLPPGWDAAWKAAKAASASTPAVVAGIGDSVTGGYGSSDALSKSWWALLRANLLGQGLSLGGDYWDLKYAGSTFSGPNLSATYIAQHGVVTTDYVSGYSAYNYFVRNTTTVLAPWLTFTTPYACTAIDIVYFDYATGTPGWTYKVDSGATVNVNTTGPSTAAGTIVKKVSITGLANTTHTVNINTTGVALTCCIMGFTTYAQTGAGLRFANHGWGGMGLVAGGAAQNNLSDTGGFPPDRLGLHQGYQGTTASPTSLRGFGFPTQPDLAIVAFGINDAINAGSATTYRDSLRRLCQSLRYGKSGDACSILIAGMYWGDGSAVGSTSVNSSDWTGTQYPGLQDLYEAMRRVAMEYNCAYASVHTLLGRTPATNGWTSSASDGHPTDTGHSKIATLLEPIL